MRNSSPRRRPCRSAMTVGICSGTPGPAAGFSSRARCSQLNEPTSSSIWHGPPSRKNPVARAPPPGIVHRRQAGHDRNDRLRSGHLGVQTIDRLDRQAGVDVRGHLDHPAVGGLGERRPECIKWADEFGFENPYPEHHCHPQRDANDAEQRPAPVGDQGGEVDPPERQPAGAQPVHHRSPGVHSPVDEMQFAGAVARRGPIVCHHDHRRAVFV